MSMLTTWGYTLTDVSALPQILSVSEYDIFTADKYSGDNRENPNILAAESAIRNYCGWHVAPSLACELSTTFFDKRVTRVGAGVLIQLPATYVTEITSLTIGGTEYDTYVIEPNGILRVYGLSGVTIYPYTAIVVDYVAGLPAGMYDGLKELIAHRVTHALSSTSGVQSESAGGVSITYNASWTNNSRATALADDNKEVLSPYRLRGVF